MIPGYRYRYPSYPSYVHTDTDTGYRYLVSVSVYGLIPGIGRTLNWTVFDKVLLKYVA